MHIFVERDLLDISGALATNMHNFPQNVMTECRRENSRMENEIFMFSECNISYIWKSSETECIPMPQSTLNLVVEEKYILSTFKDNDINIKFWKIYGK